MTYLQIFGASVLYVLACLLVSMSLMCFVATRKSIVQAGLAGIPAMLAALFGPLVIGLLVGIFLLGGIIL